MKKVILSAAAVTFAATLSFAQDAPKPAENPFKFSGQALAYGSIYQTTKKDVSSSFGALRYRPYFTYQTGNVEATVKLEIDQILGGTPSGGQADVGNDEKSVIEVKAAYLKMTIPTIEGLSVKGGADEYKTPGGFIIGTELGMGLINYKTDMIDFTAVYGKAWEPTYRDTKGDAASEKDDVNLYGADLTVSMGDIKVRPALYLLQGEKNVDTANAPAPFKGKTAIIPTFGISAKMGDLSLDFNGAYGTCGKDDNGVKYSGYAVDFAPVYAIGSTKIGGFFTMLSGDKADSLDKNESFNSFTLKYDGWGRMYLLENSQIFNNIGDVSYSDVRNKNQGYVLAGAMASTKVSAFEFKVQGGWAQLSQKTLGGSEKGLGTEIDAQISYEVEKNAKIIVEGGYLATGKAFEELNATDKQACTYAALGMAYKW